jgi:hypothetical protein
MVSFGAGFAFISIIYASFVEYASDIFIKSPTDLFFTIESSNRTVNTAIGLFGLFLASLAGGTLFTLAFGKCHQFPLFALIGTLAWFIPNAFSTLLLYLLNWNYALAGADNFTHFSSTVLLTTLNGLEGAFLGGMLGVLVRDLKKTFGLAIAGAFAFPTILKLSSLIVGWFHLAPSLPSDSSVFSLYFLYSVLKTTGVGIAFGLLLGLILGWLEKKIPIISLAQSVPYDSQPLSVRLHEILKITMRIID